MGLAFVPTESTATCLALVWASFTEYKCMRYDLRDIMVDSFSFSVWHITLVFLKCLCCLCLWIKIVEASLKIGYVGLPWWSSDWESSCQFREHGFHPWSGKIPRAAEQLSL